MAILIIVFCGNPLRRRGMSEAHSAKFVLKIFHLITRILSTVHFRCTVSLSSNLSNSHLHYYPDQLILGYLELPLQKLVISMSIFILFFIIKNI